MIDCPAHGVAVHRALCTPHPSAGKRLDLTLEQLEDLARTAIDADDRIASIVIALALTPMKRCWQPNEIERHAMAHAIDAWVGRCRRTEGHPWMRSFADPDAERRCPGCEACAVNLEVSRRPDVLADELDALSRAIGHSVGRPDEPRLVSLLRKLAPAHPVLVALGRIATEITDDEVEDRPAQTA